MNSNIEEEQTIALGEIILSTWLKTSEPEASETPETSIDQDQVLINLLAALANVTPQQLEEHPELAKNSLYQLLNDFQQVISSSLSGDQEKLDTARDRMRSLNTILKSQNIDFGDIFEQFPDNLNQLRALSDQDPDLQQMQAKLKQLAKRKPGRKSAKNLNKELVAFLQRYQQLFNQEAEAHRKAQKEQEYAEKADKAIKASLSRCNMPSLKFEDLLPKAKGN
ncbi:MAG: hypothetical protein HC827_08910 [Cyanobacteria bacterium RM1_2_2]|nr:hypothetical protein [Cyanobacteria bacterium RM1_2_2]